MTLPLTDTLLHTQGAIEAYEAAYKNQVFLSYVINSQTATLKLSTIRTVKDSRDQGLAKGALQWLCSLADTKNLKIELIAQPTLPDTGLTIETLVGLYTKFGFNITRTIQGKAGEYPIMVREVKK